MKIDSRTSCTVLGFLYLFYIINFTKIRGIDTITIKKLLNHSKTCTLGIFPHQKFFLYIITKPRIPVMGRSSKVQRAFSKAREAEAKRQHEIKIAESEVSKISQARSTLSLLSNPRARMDNTSEKYQLDRMYNSRNNTMKWGNTRGNRIDWIPVSQLQGIANQNLESAKQRVLPRRLVVPTSSSCSSSWRA